MKLQSFRLLSVKVIAARLLIAVTLSSACLVSASISVQNPQWSKTYYGSNGIAIQTSEGGFAIAGTNGSNLFFPASQLAPTLTKTDALGDVQWNKTFKANDLVSVNSLVQTTDGGYLLSGCNIANAGTSSVAWSGWLIKTDDKGNPEWNQTFGLPLETCVTIQASDGNYVSVGYMPNSFNGTDAVLLKVDENGNLLWTKTVGGNSTHFYPTSIVEANDGGYVIAGTSETAKTEGWLAKTDLNGNLQWSKTYSYEKTDDLIKAVAKTNDGGYILAGVAINGNNSWLVKTDSNGNENWSHIYPMNGFAMLFSVTQTMDGAYLAAGISNNQAVIMRTDSSGKLLYDNLYGDVGAHVMSSGTSVVLTSDGGYVVAGTLNGFALSTQGNDVTPYVGDNTWLAKFSLDSTSSAPSAPEFPSASILIVITLLVAVIAGLIITRKKSRTN